MKIPASLFVCLRRLYGYMTDSFLFLKDGVKAVLPADYTMMVANQIKPIANDFLQTSKRNCHIFHSPTNIRSSRRIVRLVNGGDLAAHFAGDLFLWFDCRFYELFASKFR